jgi:hypothetical protein
MNHTSKHTQGEREQLDFADLSDEFAVENLADEPSDQQDHVDTPGNRSSGGCTPPNTFAVESPWHETDRAAPSEFLRSELFSPNRRANQLLLNERLATNKSTDLIIWGDSLTQFDLDLWMACVHLARLGDPIRVTVPQLLKVAGRSSGGSADTRVRESLQLLSCFVARLIVRAKPRTSGISLPNAAYTFSGRLIEHIWWRPSTGRWEFANIELHPNLAELFRPQRRTHISARVRSQLGDKPLAQWMYAFLRTHRTVFPLPLAYYQKLSGAGNSLSDFRSRVKKALTVLSEGAVIHSASLRKDRLFVQRNKPVVETIYPDAEWTVRSEATNGARTRKGESQ